MATAKAKPAKEAAKPAPKKIKARRKDKKNVAFGHATSRAPSTTPLFQLQIQVVQLFLGHLLVKLDLKDHVNQHHLLRKWLLRPLLVKHKSMA